MGLFQKKKNIEELETERDKLVVEEDISTRQSSIAEKQAIISELKRRHGGLKILGVSLHTDLPTLRSMLGQAKQGMRSEAHKYGYRD